MVKVPLGTDAFKRTFAEEPEVKFVNRFFESNPTNLVDGAALLARPGTTFLVEEGAGFVRANFTQPGAFGGDLFTVVGDSLYRYDGTTVTPILGTVAMTGTPVMTVMSGIGYQYLFISDGAFLQFYEGLGRARATLMASGAIADLDTVTVGGVYYRWTSADLNAGAPDGTVAKPYLLRLAPTAKECLDVLSLALGAGGLSGTDYSNTLQQNTFAEGEFVALTGATPYLRAVARTAGAAGNAITTTVVAGAGLAWSGATFAGGGAHALQGVATPDDVGIVSLATLASHVIAVVSGSQRFYFIRPGEITIRALDFAEAESEPDQILQALTVGDQVYLFGQSTTERWYTTGDVDLPFQPVMGSAFSRGIIEGTAVKLGTDVLLVGDDQVVYRVSGGGAVPVSTNGIEEQVRVALRLEEENG